MCFQFSNSEQIEYIANFRCKTTALKIKRKQISQTKTKKKYMKVFERIMNIYDHDCAEYNEDMLSRGTQRQFSVKYLFGRRFEN